MSSRFRKVMIKEKIGESIISIVEYYHLETLQSTAVRAARKIDVVYEVVIETNSMNHISESYKDLRIVYNRYVHLKKELIVDAI